MVHVDLVLKTLVHVDWGGHLSKLEHKLLLEQLLVERLA